MFLSHCITVKEFVSTEYGKNCAGLPGPKRLKQKALQACLNMLYISLYGKTLQHATGRQSSGYCRNDPAPLGCSQKAKGPKAAHTQRQGRAALEQSGHGTAAQA